MKNLTCLIFCFFFLSALAQKECRYDKPHKFDEYPTVFATEHAGIFLNGILVPKEQFQVESYGLMGAAKNDYPEAAYAGFLQLRYGAFRHTEIQSAFTYVNPADANPDSLYNRQFIIGLKNELLSIEKWKSTWDLAVTGKYVIQQSWNENKDIRHGISATLNNSFCFINYFHMDLSGGIKYFPSDNSFLTLGSLKMLFKNEKSKRGWFWGFTGDNYLESYVTTGIEFTDNWNYSLIVAVGFLDKAVMPNIAYTHVFRK